MRLLYRFTFPIASRENEAIKLQIEVLWDKMSAAQASNHAKSYPKVVNCFEYVETASSQSSLEPLGASKNYIALPTFYMIKVRRELGPH